jgi:single-strand DNA-binding protein
MAAFSATFTGIIQTEPEMRYTPTGVAVTKYSVAVRMGNTADKHFTMWMRCSSWNKQAEYVAEHLKKGDTVTITGELTPDAETGAPRIWTGTNGTTHADYEIRVSTVDVIRKKEWDGEKSPTMGAAKSKATPVSEATNEDEIPF